MGPCRMRPHACSFLRKETPQSRFYPRETESCRFTGLRCHRTEFKAGEKKVARRLGGKSYKGGSHRRGETQNLCIKSIQILS